MGVLSGDPRRHRRYCTPPHTQENRRGDTNLQPRLPHLHLLKHKTLSYSLLMTGTRRFHMQCVNSFSGQFLKERVKGDRFLIEKLDSHCRFSLPAPHFSKNYGIGHKNKIKIPIYNCVPIIRLSAQSPPCLVITRVPTWPHVCRWQRGLLAGSAGVTEAHAGAAAAAAVASSVDRYRVLFTISGVATDDWKPDR